MALSLEVVSFIAVMCESVLVGVYAVLVLATCYILRTTARMSTSRKVLFGASILMFVISAVHLGLVMQQVTSPRIPEANRKIQIIISACQFVIGDMILIWRVWHVWGRNYWIAGGPFALMVAAAGLTFNLARGQGFFLVLPSALILANTITCTLLLAGRIWFMGLRLRKTTNTHVSEAPNYAGVMVLIIESGMLYSLTIIINLILYSVGSNGLSIMLDSEIPLVGILPTLIVVLVHFDMVPGSRTKNRHAASINTWQLQTNATSVVVSQTMVVSDGAGPSRSMIFPSFDDNKGVLEQGKQRADDGSFLSGV